MRLYYHDSYTQNFQARLLEQVLLEGRPALLLDQSYFYPAGGGQPHDLGTLNGQAVLDVQSRAEDGAVLHFLEAPLDLSPGEAVSGQILWPRRFDLMQQHSGQHILSRACENLLGAATVGFHLTEASLTIDLDRPDLPPADLLAAETLANQIIIEDRPLRAWFPDESERAALDLRQRFQVEGPLRVVEIADFDACACGGTHVSRTGEIGQIKITKVERAKKATRLEFKCGWRALADYREKHQALMTLAGELTVGYWQVAESVLALREDNKTLQKELHTAQARLLDYEAEELWRSTPPNEKGQIIIRQVWEGRPAGDLNKLALALSQKPGTLALLASSGEKAALVIAATEGSGWDAAALLKVALAPFGAKGGGRPTLAQGGGFPATAEQLRAALNFS